MTHVRLGYQMRKNRTLLLLLLLPALSGCASFNSGDLAVNRREAREMASDKGITPFAKLEVSWKNFPYRSMEDYIGEGSISNPKRIVPVPVSPEDGDAFAEKAREIFKRSGLYDRERGRGTLRLELTSFGRWTYSELFRSFLVDTGFIFILPASLRVNYYLAAEFEVPGGPMRVAEEAHNKTTFHLLLAPLYPFFSPGARESSLLKKMLLRSAADVYEKLKAAGVPAEKLPPEPKERGNPPPAVPEPPMQPDRTWIPGTTSNEATAGDTGQISPDQPDRSWAVPANRAQPSR